MGFPGSSAGKESTCNAGDLSLIPGSGRSPGEGIGYPLLCSWISLVAQLIKNPPAMWETWVRSLGWEDPRRKERQPTPVFWPGEFHGLYRTWGHKMLDTTEQLSLLLSKTVPYSEMHWGPRGIERRLRSYTIFPTYLHNYSKEKFSNGVNIPGIFHKKKGSVKIKVNII